MKLLKKLLKLKFLVYGAFIICIIELEGELNRCFEETYSI